MGIWEYGNTGLWNPGQWERGVAVKWIEFLDRRSPNPILPYSHNPIFFYS
jgi:hypothetical protein